MNSHLRLIRRVVGRTGSLQLYQHDCVGLVEILQVDAVLELRRHPSNALGDVLEYVDEVQRNIDANPDGVSMPKAAKRTRGGRLCSGSQWKARSGPSRKALSGA